MWTWSPSAALTLFHLVVAVLVSARVTRVVWRQQTVPSLDVHGEADYDPAQTVSIVVPMRNEEANVARCLASLTALRGNLVEIIIIDDHSEDETFAIACTMAKRDHRIRIVRGRDLPAGWTGKNFALQQGADLAHGEWLLFVDADVELHRAAVVCALDHAERHALAFLSLSPYQRCEGFWERLIQPVAFEMLNERYDLRAVNDPSTGIAAANGQFILVRQHVYKMLGGHAAVKGQILEDVALAEMVKQRGLPFHFANTRALAQTRMYRGFRALWEGWSKNLFVLLGGRQRDVWRTATRQVALSVLPCVTAAVAFGRLALGASEWWLAAVTGIVAVGCVITQQRLGSANGSGTWASAMLAPLARAIFVLIVVNSWYRHVMRKDVRWKGRSYPVS